MNQSMKLALERARKTMNKGHGGPFGAVIVNAKGKVIAISSNSVLKDNDPTAHAEVNAIRKACKKRKTYDLSDCVLYTTSYPCPMCLSAAIWANIKKIYYASTSTDVEKIGFRDDHIYRFIQGNCENVQVLEITEMDREECQTLLEEYEKQKKIIY